MFFVYVVSSAIVAYLLGSISAAVWIGKTFYQIDVREHGSGNAGATNVLRVLGLKAALPCFAIDMLKGVAAVSLARLVPLDSPEGVGILKIVLGCIAVVGHVFPVFAGFMGGKGVATMFGVAVAVNPIGSLVAILVFIFTFIVSRTVSISSILGAIAFPLGVFFISESPLISEKVFSIIAAILIIYTHRKNIQRLLAGTEPKTTFRKKHEEAEEA